ncbi:polyprotein [Nephotettix cincticeps positive-stranded RNA virus-1]|nr:polyprotein [Nephotettix cincticeps positive-stranded RNA virus-1]
MDSRVPQSGESALAFALREGEFPPLTIWGEELFSNEEFSTDFWQDDDLPAPIPLAELLGTRPPECRRQSLPQVTTSLEVEATYAFPIGPQPRWWYLPPRAEQRAFKTFVREELAKGGNARYERIKILEELFKSVSDDWHKRYLYRLIKEKRREGRLAAAIRRVAEQRHKENQKSWFEEGGREAAYRRKYHYGSLTHAWFVQALARTVEMRIDAFDEECWDEDEASPLKGGRLPPKRPRQEPEYYGPYHRPQPAPKPRNTVLLWVLRTKIAQLRAKRVGSEFVPIRFPTLPYDRVKFEADDGPHGEDEAPSIVQKSNIVITEQHGASIAADTPAAPSASLVCSDIVDNYSSLVNRELLFKTVTWSNEEQGASLLTVDLPRAFVTSIAGTPNSVPFDFNRYMRGDICVRVQVNSNPFMIGSLQVAWYYQADCDKNIANRMNVASYSQTLHALVNAGTSNEAILEIPYKNFKPLMEVGQRVDKDKSLYMGRLVISVLNKLQATSTSSNAASVSVFISFKNTEFTGYIHRDLNKPEMEAAAGMIALGVAERMLDSNRDKPTSSARPQYVSLQVAQSWSHGTNMSEDTFDLRLSRADAPHPARYTDAAFTQRDICNRFGYVKTLEWPTSLASGVRLYSFAGAPCLNKGFYHSISTVDQGEAYVLPPVAFMSNLFQYWRGSLKLRLDFVATKFHTGRLLLTYVPGDYQPDLSLEQVKASTSVIFDLKESQQCNFIIPYMADKQYWPRYYEMGSSDSNSYAPGYVYIFVLNKLVAMDNISNKVYVNMYIAGADDFECVIPAQPTIGLAFNTSEIVPTAAEAYISNQTSDGHYTGTYTHLELNDSSQNFYPGILRYGPIYEHIAQVWMPKSPDYSNKKFYYLKCKNWQILVRSSPDKSQPDVKTDIAIPFYDGDYIYALPCRSATRAELWCKDMIAANGNYKQFATTDYCRQTFYAYPKGDDADPYQQGKFFTLVEVTNLDVGDASYSFVDYDDCAKGEMDSRVDIEQPILSGVGLVPSTGYGRSELGEAFGDLKDICRRYQLYGSCDFDVSSVVQPGQVLFEFPVLPQGLDLNIGSQTSPNYLWNHLREGIIPLLLSGYRFFRGSLRFRIVLPDTNTSYFVQHIPYAYRKERKIKPIASYVDGTNAFNHGYAYTVQSRFLNNVLSFEVPYYLNVDCMMLQQSELPSSIKGATDLAFALSLGVVRIGSLKKIPLNLKKKINFNFEIAYALGDDARPSVFQGFSPVIFTNDIPPAPAADVVKFEIFDDLQKAMKLTRALGDVNLNQVEERTVEALANVSDASSTMKGFIDKLSTAGSSVTKVYDEMMAALKDSHAPQVILNALSQCAQVLYNPCPVVMAIAVGSFLMSLGIVCFESLKTVVDLCTKSFRALLDQHPEGESAKPEADFDAADLPAVASILFAGVSTALNVKAQSDSKFTKGIALDLMDGLTKGSSSGFIFFRFLANILGTLTKIYDYIVSKLFPEKLGLEHLVSEREMITKWCEQCVFLLAPENENIYDISSCMVDQVHSAYVLGSVIMAKLSSVPKGVNAAIIKDFYAKIVQLRTNLYDKGYGGTVRREPFVCWMGGAPGIGKSHLASYMCLEMLQHARVPITGSPIYAHPAGAKYWENLNQEPVILMDDAFVTRSGEINESEIQTFMSIKSPCLFTPPMAECDRKKKRYAPEIVYVNSNNNFPELNNMECKEAIYRRRDIMWIAHLKADYADIKTVPPEVLARFDHLFFQQVLYPAKPERFDTHRAYHSFQEMRMITLQAFSSFRQNQIRAHQAKVDYIHESVQAVMRDERFASDPLAEYLRNYAETYSFPSITSFIPEAERLVRRARQRENEVRPEMSPPAKMETPTIMVSNFLREKGSDWNETENQIAIFFVHRQYQKFRSDMKMGLLANCIKNEKILPGEYLAYFALGNKFISLLDYMQCSDGLGTLYLQLRDSTKSRTHYGCDTGTAQAAFNLFPIDYFENETHCIQLKELNGVIPLEAAEVIDNVGKIVAAKKSFELVASACNIPVPGPSVNVSEVVLLNKIDWDKKRAHDEKKRAEYLKKELDDMEKDFAQHLAEVGASVDEDDELHFAMTKEEGIKKFKEFKYDDICEYHSTLLYNSLRIGQKSEGAKLLFPKSTLVELSDKSKFQSRIRQIIKSGNKNWICPHLLAVFRPFSAKATTCCFKALDVAHWCSQKGCTNKTCIGNLRTILDMKCEGSCCLKNTHMLKQLRALWLKNNPGIATKLASDSELVPEVFKFSISRIIYDNIKDSIASFFKSIWEYLKKAGAMFTSAAAATIRFIKRYKWIFVSAAAIIGGFFLATRGDTSKLQTHVAAVIHTTPGEIKEGVCSLYNGTKDNVKDMFRSVKNCISGNKGVGDVGEVSEVTTLSANPEMVSSSDPRMTQRSARASFKATTLSKVSGKAHPKAEGSQTHDVLRRLLIKNTVILVGYSGDIVPADINSVNSSVIRGLFIGDRFCVTVAHSWEVFVNSGYDRIGFFIRDRWVSVKLNSVDYIGMSDDCLCVLEFPASVPQFRNIVNFIATEADHCIRTPSNGSLIKIDEHLTEVLVPITPRLEKLPISGTRLSRSAVAETSYQYPIQGNGVCGSVLVAADRQAPIFGMHCAGNDATRIGYAVPLYRETFQPLFDCKPIVEFAYSADTVLLDHRDSVVDINTTIFEVGKVPKSHEHTSAHKTQIVKSEIFDYIPHTTEPAPLHPKDPRLPPGNSPLVRGVEKHGIMTDDFPVDVVQRTRERLRTFLLVNCKPHRTVADPVLTEQQAVCGDSQLPFCDPLAWTSSEGYPWSAIRPAGATDKKWLFNLEETPQGLKLISFHPKLAHHLYGSRNRRKMNQMCPTIFTDCLKDARIPLEKVSVPGKTRIFSMSPVDYTIDFRIHFYDFISSFQHSRFQCSNMIGVNVFSDEWNVLARTLLRHNNICTGDYSNFGPGLNSHVAQNCCELILEWYDFYWPAMSDEDRNIRRCMLAELINAMHLCKDLVYKVGAGIPSGSPITVVLNSLVNIFYIYAAWDMLSVDWDPQFQSFQNFPENVVLYTYGDDFIFSVSDLYKDLFNTKTISNILGEYKIKLTDAFKGEEITPYAPLAESSFLKNRFVFHSGRYWAALDLDSIHDMCNWVKESTDPRQAIIDNCEAALLHMQGWGCSRFGVFRILLINTLGEKGIEFHPRTWTQIYRLKLGSDSDPSYAAYIHKMVG